MRRRLIEALRHISMKGEWQMFPLEVVLIGRTEEVLESIRSELVANEASVSAEFPDVASALDAAEETGRRLFLFHVREPEDVRQLQKLVRTFAGQPVLAVVEPEIQEAYERSRLALQAGASASARATLFIQAMRAGAMQVVPLPLEPADFRDAMDCLAAQFGKNSESTVIAVSGVQGGCGATTLAINLAHAISEVCGQSCVLAELAPHAGMLATYLNIKPECTLGELMEREHLDTQTIRQALVPISPKLSVLCGPYRDIVVRGPSDRAMSTCEILSIFDSLRRLAPVVVVDVPAWFDETYFEALRKADKLVLVTEQTVPALHSLQMVERALPTNERQSLDVVINRFDSRAKGLSLEEMKPLVRGAIHKIGVDPAMTAAANEGRLLRVAAPRSRIALEIEELATRLVKPPPQMKQAGFWEKILGHSGQHIAEGG